MGRRLFAEVVGRGCGSGKGGSQNSTLKLLCWMADARIVGCEEGEGGGAVRG